MKKEIKCHNCYTGTLELLTKREVKKVKDEHSHGEIGDKLYGCDDCKFWCDASVVDVYK